MAKSRIVIKRNRLTKSQKGQLIRRFKQGMNINETLIIVKKQFPWIRRAVVAYHYNIWLNNKKTVETNSEITPADFKIPTWESGLPDNMNEMEDLAQSMSSTQSTIQELKQEYHEKAELHAELSAMYYRAGESLSVVSSISTWDEANPHSGSTIQQLRDFLNHIRNANLMLEH